MVSEDTIHRYGFYTVYTIIVMSFGIYFSDLFTFGDNYTVFRIVSIIIVALFGIHVFRYIGCVCASSGINCCDCCDGSGYSSSGTTTYYGTTTQPSTTYNSYTTETTSYSPPPSNYTMGGYNPDTYQYESGRVYNNGVYQYSVPSGYTYPNYSS